MKRNDSLIFFPIRTVTANNARYYYNVYQIQTVPPHGKKGLKMRGVPCFCSKGMSANAISCQRIRNILQRLGQYYTIKNYPDNSNVVEWLLSSYNYKHYHDTKLSFK